MANTDSTVPSALDALQKRLTGNALGTVIGRVIGIAVSLWVNILLGRELSPAEFGVWGLFFSVVILGTSIGKYSLSEVLTRQVAECLTFNAREQFATIVRRLTLLALGSGTVAALVGAVVLGILIAPPPGLQILLLCGAIIFFSVLSSMRGAYFRGLHLAWLVSVAVPIPSGLIVGPILLLAIYNKLWQSLPLSLNFVLICWLGSLIVTCLLLEVLRKFVPVGFAGHPPDHRELDAAQFQSRAILLAATPLMLSEVSFHFLMQADLWLGSLLASEAQLGYLTGAKRLGGLVDLPVAMGNLAMASTFAELYASGKLPELERLARRIAALLSGLGFLACLLGVCCGSWIMATVYQPSFGQAGHYLALIIVARLAFACGGPASVILMMTGGGAVLLKGYLLSVFVMLVGSAILGLLLGIPGLLIANGLGIALSAYVFGRAIYLRDHILVHAPWPWHPSGLKWWFGLLKRKRSGQ